MSNQWEKKESEDRVAKFLKEYKELCKKFEVELMAYPMYVPSGNKGFNTAAALTPVDKKAQGVPSPLQNEDGSIIK